jgi:DNA-directed RNA polymerase subunit N (RpoN/RPB10)
VLIPVRCLTCGKLIADKFDDYQNKMKAGCRNNTTSYSILRSNSEKKARSSI